ncbi:glycosyltransferase family 2 protein [Limnobacter sp.]|uniref:glycosyltransferase family 2 protein n=1 Tax=Limnobacter sp. TaxID=2003368 RepID=UPI0035110D32
MPSILALFAFVLLVLGGYGYVNQPAQEPPWVDIIPGYAFSPYQPGQSPVDNIHPSSQDIERDLALLSGKTHAIRTYTVEGVFGEVPALAKKYGLNVALGAWLAANEQANQEEITRLTSALASAPGNVVRVVVGNETLLREDLTPEQIIPYLKEVRSKTRLPVSTAEPWHVWIKNPELAEHVDYLAVHLLPFWEGIALNDAVDYAFGRYRELQAAFPGKPIVITEVGWPSHGRSIKQANASQANQAKFLRRFVHSAEEQGLVFYVMEAFDQPWKTDIEGSVGGHWGVFDAQRQQKFETSNPIIPIPQWQLLASASVLVALLLIVFLLMDSASLRDSGRTFLMFNAFVVSSLIIYVIYDFTLQYHTWASMAVSVVLLLGVVGVFVIVLAEAHEWAESMWYKARKRLLKVEADAWVPHTQPFVSIHVPAHEEPPAMLIQTLNALARLDYPNFEVLVIDNNTASESTWRPVQAHCEALGQRFRFFHVKPLAGYKAGALNYALERTSEQAEVVAVIDADYQVHPDWLKHLAPQFEKPSIAIVQAPQDYRDGSESAFKAMCYAEYKGFFHLGMVTRNERNAIIQHGTMTMVRKSVLQGVGGWGTSTITEDTELGLRIFEQGHEAVYIDRSYGQGLIPDTFTDYKKQRHRWAYGAMQILREHAGELLRSKRSKLQPGQRYHFFAGWLPWVADGFNLVFTGLALVWSALMLWDPLSFNAPPLLISVVPLMFFAFKLVKLFTLYVWQVKTGVRGAVAATLAGLSLSYTIGRATLSGLFIGKKIPFIRTPKLASRAAVLRALSAARDESILALALLCNVGALWLALGYDSRENLAWSLVLITQSLPFLAAVLVSLVSAMPAKPSGETVGNPV